MKLYTINATWVRPTDTEQDKAYKEARYSGTVAQILDKYGVDGFTIYKVDGYWNREAELSYKIEIATELSLDKMLEICERLRKEYQQDAVMLTLPDNSVEFIERP